MPRIAEVVNVQELNERWSTLPRPAEQYRWAAEYSKMIRHTQGDPDCGVITMRRPYEPDEVKDFRIASFRAITKAPMTQAINTLQRLFSKSAVDVQWPEPASEYLDGKNFEGSDFLGYINKFVVRRMVEDPNGFLIWWADYPGSPTVRALPRPILLLSEDVLHKTADVLCFLSEEKSPVLQRDGRGRFRTVNEGNVFYIVTRAAFYKRVQYGDQAKGLYRIEPGLQHNIGSLPVIQLGGEEVIRAKKGQLKPETWLSSYLEPATQYGDEALAQFSDWQAVMVTSAYPIREMETIKCTNADCNKGKVYTKENGQEVVKTCPVCKGEREIIPDSPFGIIKRREKRAGFADVPKADPVAPVRFLHADPAILQQIEKAWRELVKDMRDALHLLFIQEAQSGVAKQVDREDKLSTLDRMGQQVFEVIVANSLRFALTIMNMPVDIQINMPTTFHVRSEEDLRKEVAELSGPGIQPLYRGLAITEMLRKRYPSNGYASKIMEVIGYFDLAFGYNPQEKASMAASGVLSDEVVQRSAMAEGFLRRMAIDQGDAFLSKKTKDLAAELEKAIAEELAARPVIKPEPPTM